MATDTLSKRIENLISMIKGQLGIDINYNADVVNNSIIFTFRQSSINGDLLYNIEYDREVIMNEISLGVLASSMIQQIKNTLNKNFNNTLPSDFVTPKGVVYPSYSPEGNIPYFVNPYDTGAATYTPKKRKHGHITYPTPTEINYERDYEFLIL